MSSKSVTIPLRVSVEELERIDALALEHAGGNRSEWIRRVATMPPGTVDYRPLAKEILRRMYAAMMESD